MKVEEQNGVPADWSDDMLCCESHKLSHFTAAEAGTILTIR